MPTSSLSTYHLAHAARAKLGHEASRPSHNLRRLVGHANLLDTLMTELSTPPRHITFASTPSPSSSSSSSSQSTADEENDSVSDSSDSEYEYDAYSDSESDYDDSEELAAFHSSQHAQTWLKDARGHGHSYDHEYEFDNEEDEEDADNLDDDDEDNDDLRLTRTQSRSAGPSLLCPPGLEDDDDSDPDDISMPPSPETAPVSYRGPSSKESPLFLSAPPRSLGRLTSF